MTRPSATTTLGLNAALSLILGALLAIAPGTVGGWLGVSVDGWLRILGLTLIAHAILLGWMVTKLDGQRALRLNLALIGGYPLLMLVVVSVGWVSTGIGRALVLADAAVITLFVVFHLNGIRSPAEA